MIAFTETSENFKSKFDLKKEGISKIRTRTVIDNDEQTDNEIHTLDDR